MAAQLALVVRVGRELELPGLVEWELGQPGLVVQEPGAQVSALEAVPVWVVLVKGLLQLEALEAGGPSWALALALPVWWALVVRVLSGRPAAAGLPQGQVQERLARWSPPRPSRP